MCTVAPCSAPVHHTTHPHLAWSGFVFASVTRRFPTLPPPPTHPIPPISLVQEVETAHDLARHQGFVRRVPAFIQ